jgi:hypothetical protein
MVTGDQRAAVVDLRSARLERLARSLAPALEAGQAIAETAGVSSVSDWRAAARRVSRGRRWKIRTGVTPDGSRVWAVRLDREVTADDREVLRRRLNYLSAVLSPK